MQDKVIRNTTQQQTQQFLDNAVAAINQNPNAVKYRKGSSKYDQKVNDLDYSIIQAEDGQWYVLGNRKIHFLGKGTYSEARLAYRLIPTRDERGHLVKLDLGEEMVVKERDHDEFPSAQVYILPDRNAYKTANYDNGYIYTQNDERLYYIRNGEMEEVTVKDKSKIAVFRMATPNQTHFLDANVIFEAITLNGGILLDHLKKNLKKI